MVIGMVEAEAYAGKLDKNPFNFKHFDIEEISISIEGESIFQPFKFNFDESKFLLGYYSLFTGIETSLISGNDITIEDYKNGYTLLALNLNQDGTSNLDHLNLDRFGNLRLSFKFRKSLAKAITLILYYEFDSIMEITRNKTVVLDTTL